MVASRSSSLPRTDTYTRACLRSGLVSTEVTVTNPMRGSLSPSARRAETTSRTASFTRRMRSAILEQVFPGNHPTFHRCTVGEHRDHVALQSCSLIAQDARLPAHQRRGQLGTLP